MRPFSKWATLLAGLLLSAAVQADLNRPGDVGNVSPVGDSKSAVRANELADKAMYKPFDYQNASMRGPNLVVIPGEIKSTNASFTQRFGPNNIADFAELEFGRANFGVLERSDMGPLLQEFQLAYTMGDPVAAGKLLQRGKLKTTKWVVKLDILKAEQVAAAQGGFDGQALGQLISLFGSARSDTARRNSDAAGNILGSVKTTEGTGVWIIGMRFKIMNAVTTEQVATGYTEEKMEIGATTSSVLGFSQGVQGGLTLDGMVQRLVQKLVWEIDAQYKQADVAPETVPSTRSVSITAGEQKAADNGAPQTTISPSDLDPDSETWRMALRANSAPAYRAYLDAFPAGRYLAAARIALASVVSPAEPARTAVTSAPTPTTLQKPVPEKPRSSEGPALAAEPQPPAIAPREATGQTEASTDRPVVSAAQPPCPVSAPLSEWNDCIGSERDAQGATIYEGGYQDGKRHGAGSYQWSNGERYEGQFFEGRIEGQGARTWPNGERYVGTFKDGNSHGEGVFSWPNGEKYSGQFTNGRLAGQGTRTWPNGERYVGAFNNGAIEGHGTYFWPDGEKYVGQWRNGMRHGAGAQYNAAGAIIFQGQWESNRKRIE